MSLRHSLEYAAVVFAEQLVRIAPLEASQRVLGALARAHFDRGGKRVGFALANLRVAFPDRSEDELRVIGRESYAHTAWNALDWLRSTHWSDDEILQRLEFSGLEHAYTEWERGKGGIGLTLHLGNFELLVKAMPLLGLPISAVARPMGNRRLYERVVQQRTRTGVELIDRRRAAPLILRALRDGKGVGMLVDQYIRRKHGVFVPLFGARCSTTAAPATLAMRTGAPIVPCYTIRIAPDQHRAVILPPIEVASTGDRLADIVETTARCNRVLEEVILAHPEQWMWAHRRFRHSPDLPDLAYD